MAFNSSTISVGSTTKKSHFDQLLNNTIDLKRESTTINGEKIFASATAFAKGVYSNTSTAGIAIGVGYLGQSSTASVVTLRSKIIEIGDWNMDTTVFKDVAHGVDGTKIRNFMAIIKPDSDSATPNSRSKIERAIAGVAGGSVVVDGTDNNNMHLLRATGEIFDNAAFDMSAPFNRGWIILEYEE